MQLKLCFKCNAPKRFSKHSMTKLIFLLLHACFLYSFQPEDYQLIITFLPCAKSVMPFPRCNKGTEGNYLWEQCPDNPNITLWNAMLFMQAFGSVKYPLLNNTYAFYNWLIIIHQNFRNAKSCPCKQLTSTSRVSVRILQNPSEFSWSSIMIL